MPRHGCGFKLADDHGAQLRLTRLRPSGRGADVWPELHPTTGQQRELYDWLAAHGEQVLTGDSFFHLSPYGKPLPGLNMCGAGRVVCLIDPVGDVYACPFAIHENFLAGNVRQPGGFETVWRESPLFAGLREPQTGGACRSCGSFDSCRGGCMAAKFFTGLPLDGPDPECVQGYGEAALAVIQPGDARPPRPAADHSHRVVPVSIGRRPPQRACDETPLAGHGHAFTGETCRCRITERAEHARAEKPGEQRHVGVPEREVRIYSYRCPGPLRAERAAAAELVRRKWSSAGGQSLRSLCRVQSWFLLRPSGVPLRARATHDAPRPVGVMVRGLCGPRVARGRHGTRRGTRSHGTTGTCR